MGCSKQTTSCGKLPQVFNTDHHQKPACAGCIGLRSRPRPHAVVEPSKITTASASTPALGPFVSELPTGGDLPAEVLALGLNPKNPNRNDGSEHG
jgi:hypothetical protein